MHPLTILAVGLYGKELPNQNGAPLRLVVPWKYGFKSIKSIVRISFTERQPPTTWSNSAPPGSTASTPTSTRTVDHPRWSQASERRIGGGLFVAAQPTLMFNGYAEQVAGLYAGWTWRRTSSAWIRHQRHDRPPASGRSMRRLSCPPFARSGLS